MKKALDLLELQKEILSAKDSDALAFTAVNGLYKLLPYKQAVFWTGPVHAAGFVQISGNADIDPKGAFAYWLKTILKRYAPQEGRIFRKIDLKDIEERDRSDWQNFAAPHAAILVFKSGKGEVLGGLWLERDHEFTDADKTILKELHAPFSTVLSLQKLRGKKSLSSGWRQMTRYKKMILFLLVALFFVPVRLSITAPAEIISADPYIITPAINGNVEEVLVRPGDVIEEGAVLIRLEAQDLESEKRAAEQDLKLAETKLAGLRRQALLDPEKKAELEALRADIELKQIELDYAVQRLGRTTLKAPGAGVAVFSDSSALEGKPVMPGERLMQIADASKAELFVRIPSDSLIPIEADVPIRFYTNVDPLDTREATIRSIGYQAGADPDGLLTYKLRASLPDDYTPRIGWKGTAKIYGGWSVLGYAILRRPLIALRDVTGL